jgi:type I restriction enzyme R subunit
MLKAVLRIVKNKRMVWISLKKMGTFVRFYEFISQIVDYDDKDLEKLNLYARNLSPLLRESLPEDDDIDLSVVELSYYRLSAIRQQDLKLKEDSGEYKL